MAERLRDVVGLRVIFRIGPTRLLRAVAVFVLVAACGLRLASINPNPAAIGQDTWNYLAAGERLNAGHSIYTLSPGDRPTIIWPAGSVALGSPPLVAVIWRPLALAPDWLAMWLWFLSSALLMFATALWICLKGRWPAVILGCLLAPTFAADVFSGNLNAFLAPLMAFSWWSLEAGRARAAGLSTALGAMLKIGPGALVFWLAVRREGRALVAFAIGVAALALTSLIGAGWQQHLDFLDFARSSTDAAWWRASVPGILKTLGAPDIALELSIPATWVVGAAVIWALRHRPAGAFAAAVVLSIWGTSVVHIGTVGLLLAALAPLAPAPAWIAGRTSATADPLRPLPGRQARAPGLGRSPASTPARGEPT